MPKLQNIVHALPTDCHITFDRDGAHLWDASKGEAPADALRVKYRPGYATAKYYRTVDKVNADPERSGAVWQFLQVVAEWDMQDETTGEILPLSDEGLEDVPLPLLNGIVAAVQEDMRPKSR